jgi:HAMP domain-containing protein
VPAAPVPAPELGELGAAVDGLRRELASLSTEPAAPAPELAELAAALDALRREVAAMAVPAAPVPAPELGELGAAVDGLRRELASVTAQQTIHLERLRAEIAEARTAAEPPPSLPAPQVDRDAVARLAETERRLDEREAQLEERLAVVARRELELARRASELAARERTAASAQREPEPPPPAPVVAPAAPEPASAFDLERLERLVAENEARFPERAEEWRSYLFYLRDYVGADGRVPQRFEALVTDIFGDLGV